MILDIIKNGDSTISEKLSDFIIGSEIAGSIIVDTMDSGQQYGSAKWVLYGLGVIYAGYRIVNEHLKYKKLKEEKQK